MTESWEKALMVAGVVFAIQLTENWILVPRVMKGAVGLTPLTVFLAILVGTEFMGVVGALLSIPIAAAVQVIVGDLIKARKAEEQAPQTVSSWRWLGERLMPDRDPWSRPPAASQATQSRGDLMTADPSSRAGFAAPGIVPKRESDNGSGGEQDKPPGSLPKPSAAAE
jgi:hypothetical protein